MRFHIYRKMKLKTEKFISVRNIKGIILLLNVKIKLIADNLCTPKNEILQKVTLLDVNKYLQNAAHKGYELCQKEYEEKLRWIPVEEKLPDIDSDYPNFSVEVHVKNTEQSYVIAYYYFNEERWCFNNNSIDNVTHWRSFL